MHPVNSVKARLTQAIFAAKLNEIYVALKLQTVAIHRDFSAVCQKRRCTSISYTKAMRVLKSETASQSHLVL